ncbi:hypothetical protein T492DRAFT_1120745 [Pavlovales sp. CCMP2436]|nr:hypothetical protein T492DRAFT_1120745 [Pavlovales sp. CCMP2436]
MQSSGMLLCPCLLLLLPGALGFSRAELLSIAREDNARWDHCISDHDLATCMSNADANLKWFTPTFGSPLSFKGVLNTFVAPMTDGSIKSMSSWPNKIAQCHRMQLIPEERSRCAFEKEVRELPQPRKTIGTDTPRG